MFSNSTSRNKTYKDVVKLLTDHYRPKPVIAVERFKFHSRTRQPNESVSTYLAYLRESSEFCNFGDSLEDMLRDKLVCGVNDARIQKLLLSEKDITFRRAQELARSEYAGCNKIPGFVSTDSHELRISEQKTLVNKRCRSRLHRYPRTVITVGPSTPIFIVGSRRPLAIL